MEYRLLADAILLLHFAFILFAIFGGLLALRWPRAPLLHLGAMAWASYVMLSGRICPLTPIENHFRKLGGQSGYEGGFVEHYILPIIYPDDLTREIQIAIGVAVLMVNIMIYCAVLWRNRHAHTHNVHA